MHTPTTHHRSRRAALGNLRRRVPAALLVAGLAAVGAACEGDDDQLDATACDAYANFQAAMFGDPAGLVAAGEAFAAAVPDDLADSVDVMLAALSSADEGASETPEFAAAQTAVGNAVFDDCSADATADVTGVDYSFTGMPAELAAGRLKLRFTNRTQTDEPHELVILAGTNGETAAELKELPLEQLFGVVRPVSVAFAGTKGGVATTLVDLEPGEYLVICTLPVGGPDAAEDGPGDPHANHGMVAALTVA